MLNIPYLFYQYGTLTAIIILVWYVFVAAGLWKTFEKAGEAGWKALIPIYNFYILFKISWEGRMFWLWILCTLFAGLLSYWGYGNAMMYYFGVALNLVQGIMLAVLYYNVSLAFDHGLGYFLGLYFLTPLFILILGFGGSRYVGNRYSNRL